MSSDPKRAQAVFLAAVETPSTERGALLDRECNGNEELRHRVEALLKAHDEPDSFLESPPPGIEVPSVSPIAEQPGAVIGPYKLLEQIGEGGFGVVFLAEQERPVRRKVALKVIKPGMDTRQVIARFEAERQALAMMDHPNIAKVLDAGTIGVGQAFQPDANLAGEKSRAGKPDLHAGRPYFVMELVQGVPITEYCDQCNLTTRERLELFITVCHAVQHAHQKGIIHRDIKPTNVLVAIQDGRPAPKIIDFGVAKAIDRRLTEHTLTTAFAQMVGSPLYMSPEQAELSPLGVDTRSDIYSLGVMLYELLAGTTPFDKDRLHAAPYDELRRIIREEEPPRPSARLSSLTSTSGSLPLAGRAGEGETAKLATTIAAHRRTDPGRLVQTVRGELDWIVMKCLEKDRNRRYETPNSLARDIERYLNDEPVEACPPSAAYRLRKFARRNKGPALAFSIVLLALIAGVVGMTWGMVRAEKQRRVAELNARKALAAAEAEKIAKQAAQTREAEMKDVLDFVERRVFAAARQEGLGYDVTIRRAVEAALPFVETSFTNRPLVEARLRMSLGRAFGYAGEPAIAADQYQKARALFTEHLGPDHQDTLEPMNNLGASYQQLGRHEEALKLHEETLALTKAKLGPNHEDTLRSMSNLASCYDALGRQGDALALREEILALGKSTRFGRFADPIVDMHNLAWSYYELGRYDEALKLNEEALALFKSKLGPDHPLALGSMANQARYYRALGRRTEALRLGEEALALQEVKLGPKHPDTLETMNGLAWALATDTEPAARNPGRALELAKRAVELAPTKGDFHNTLGAVRYRAGDWPAAIEALEQSMELRNGGDSSDFFFLAMAHWQLGHKDEARKWHEQAVAWMQRNNPDNVELNRLRAEAAALLGITEPKPESAPVKPVDLPAKTDTPATTSQPTTDN